MATLKCKMCGGDLVFEPDSTVCECEFCGSRQTIPTVDNEKKIKLFDRANRLRMNGEFDKAGTVYENIISDFDDEAEAYWGNLLCKYGVEYVDDPATGDKIPTCHRASFDCFMDDSDFEMVMEYADDTSRAVYREQAKQIESIRKQILEVSGKENPYDIFICYKETDKNGDRTIDSVIAQNVYEALTEKEYRVFFSRISLEDKLGKEYEPYIFAALNSAKIMLAFGSSYENYNAVWVKNEWSRYLKIIAKDKNKYLIPCFKDIDAYDLPKEFRALQAQDMGKVGAIQDLIRGIEKIIGTKKERTRNADSTFEQPQQAFDAAVKREVEKMRTERAVPEFAAGHRHFANGNYEAAAKSYSIVLQWLPDDFQSAYRAVLCRMYLNKKDADASLLLDAINTAKVKINNFGKKADKIKDYNISDQVIREYNNDLRNYVEYCEAMVPIKNLPFDSLEVCNTQTELWGKSATLIAAGLQGITDEGLLKPCLLEEYERFKGWLNADITYKKSVFGLNGIFKPNLGSISSQIVKLNEVLNNTTKTQNISVTTDMDLPHYIMSSNIRAAIIEAIKTVVDLFNNLPSRLEKLQELNKAVDLTNKKESKSRAAYDLAAKKYDNYMLQLSNKKKEESKEQKNQIIKYSAIAFSTLLVIGILLILLKIAAFIILVIIAGVLCGYVIKWKFDDLYKVNPDDKADDLKYEMEELKVQYIRDKEENRDAILNLTKFKDTALPNIY